MKEKKTGKWKTIRIKALIVQITFLIMHYLYDFFPNGFTRIISGTSEAVFEHMKIAFFSYGLVSLVEFLSNRKKMVGHPGYGFARLTSTLFYCWPMFILFFAPPAYYGKYGTDLAEIISANIILYLTSLIAILLERHLEKVTFSKEFKIAMIGCFVILLSLFVIYSHRSPWFDVFAIPPGWE